jgi:hypothetical protein
LSSLPAQPLHGDGGNIENNKYFDSVLADPEALIGATALSDVVRKKGLGLAIFWVVRNGRTAAESAIVNMGAEAADDTKGSLISGAGLSAQLFELFGACPWI